MSRLGFWPKAAETFNSPLLRSKLPTDTTATSSSPAATNCLPDSPPTPPSLARVDFQTAEQLLSESELRASSGSSATPRPVDPRSGTSQAAASKPLRHAKSTSSAETSPEGGGVVDMLARLEKTTQSLQSAAAGSSFVAKHPQLLSSPPQTLFCLGVLCLALGQVKLVYGMLIWLLSVSNLSTLIGVACLVLAASSSLSRVYTMFAMQVDAIVLAIPKLPRMAEEISEMLVQIKLMRQDLQLMRSKVSWLPGGQY